MRSCDNLKDTCCIVLAAGEGKRMKSNKPKVLTEVVFKPMLGWIMDTILECGIEKTCVVTGFKNEMVNEYLNSNGYECETVIQAERKGTAHAVRMAEKFLENNKGKNVLILAGDAPFINDKIIKKAYDEHVLSNNSATLISSILDNPFGYGRVIRDNDEVVGIVEEKDASESQRKIKEVNSGAYWFSIDSLLKVLYNISNDTSQGEYYLTDAVKLLIQGNKKVGAVKSETQDVVLGANNCAQLSEMNSIARERIIKNLIDNGVNIPYWDGVVIGKDVEFDNECSVLPGTIILGKTKIEKGCLVGPNSQIINCHVGKECKINSSYCENSDIFNGSTVGPFESVVGNREKNKVSL